MKNEWFSRFHNFRQLSVWWYKLHLSDFFLILFILAEGLLIIEGMGIFHLYTLLLMWNERNFVVFILVVQTR